MSEHTEQPAPQSRHRPKRSVPPPVYLQNPEHITGRFWLIEETTPSCKAALLQATRVLPDDAVASVLLPLLNRTSPISLSRLEALVSTCGEEAHFPPRSTCQVVHESDTLLPHPVPPHIPPHCTIEQAYEQHVKHYSKKFFSSCCRRGAPSAVVGVTQAPVVTQSSEVAQGVHTRTRQRRVPTASGPDSTVADDAVYPASLAQLLFARFLYDTGVYKWAVQSLPPQQPSAPKGTKRPRERRRAPRYSVHGRQTDGGSPPPTQRARYGVVKGPVGKRTGRAVPPPARDGPTGAAKQHPAPQGEAPTEDVRHDAKKHAHGKSKPTPKHVTPKITFGKFVVRNV